MNLFVDGICKSGGDPRSDTLIRFYSSRIKGVKRHNSDGIKNSSWWIWDGAIDEAEEVIAYETKLGKLMEGRFS